MSYYEEDTPEIDAEDREILESLDAAENEGMPVKGNPEKDFLDKTPEEFRHQELMEMLGGIFVQVSRIYDILLTDSSNRAALDSEHSTGGLFASPPTLREDAWNDSEDS